MDRPFDDFCGLENQKTLHAIDAEIDNVRLAWGHAVKDVRIPDMDSTLRGMYWYMWYRNRRAECAHILHEAIVIFRQVEPTRENQLLLGVALTLDGLINIWLEEKQNERRIRLEESVAILRDLDARFELALAVGVLGWTYITEGRLEEAEEQVWEALSLAEGLDFDEYRSFFLWLLGNIARTRGQVQEAESWYLQALELGRKKRFLQAVSHTLYSMGKLAFEQGAYARAQHLFAESEAAARAQDSIVSVFNIRNRQGYVATATGALATAEAYFRENMDIARRYKNRSDLMVTYIGIADVMRSQGKYAEAQAYYLQAQQIAVEMGNREFITDVKYGKGNVALDSGRYEEAWQLFSESLEYYRQSDNQIAVANTLTALGRVALVQGDGAQSRRCFLDALAASHSIGLPPLLLSTFAGVADLLMRQGKLSQAVQLAALVFKHPASHAESRTVAARVLSDSEVELFATDLESAIQHSHHDDLATVADDLAKQLEAQADQPLVEPLSERELEVLQLVANGRSNRQIAQDLTLALGTVKSHLHNILQKLDADNRTEAVTRARDLRLLQ